MSANCDIIVTSPIYEQYEAIQKTDCGRMVCKTYICIKSNLFYFTKIENRTKKSLMKLSYYYFA